MADTPNIRFKGFTEPWEQRKLGEICSRVQGNDGRMNLPTLTISAANGWMKQEDRFSGNIAGKEQKNYTLLHKGELSYNHGNSKLAKYGTVFSLQTYEEALVPRVYHSFKVKIGNADFIEYYFATKIPDWELRKLISSGARMDGLLNIGYDDFMGIKMMFPPTPEQNKIAEYFRRLDHLITLHQRKCDETKELKKYMLQKMFPKKGEQNPEIRFEGFTEPWEQRKLGDICERVTRKNKNNQSDLPLTISSQYGLIDQRNFFNKVVAAKDMSDYYLLQNGEYAYNKSYSNGYDYGSIKRLNAYEQGCLSTLYICFSLEALDVDSDYLECFFDTLQWYSDVSMICADGARNHGLLNVDTKAFFTDVRISLPISIKEQRLIAKYLNNLDNLITLHQRKCDKLKEMKKYMLQNMFPKKG